MKNGKNRNKLKFNYLILLAKLLSHVIHSQDKLNLLNLNKISQNREVSRALSLVIKPPFLT
jgi:hypothetical protein